jgi:DnaJ-class molecular chaperone
VQGKGTAGQAGHRDGDLLVEIDAQDDPYFQRNNADVHVDIPAILSENSKASGGEVWDFSRNLGLFVAQYIKTT